MCHGPSGRCSCHLDKLCWQKLPVGEGEGILPFIEWAQETLFLTNLTLQQYKHAYVKAHLDALNRGVDCTRIVRISNQHPEAFRWIGTYFDKKTKKPIGKYTQYNYPEADHARLDIAIIDGIYFVEIRWAPLNTHDLDIGGQDMFYAVKDPEYAAFRGESWDEHIQALNLKKIGTLNAFEKLLNVAKKSRCLVPQSSGVG